MEDRHIISSPMSEAETGTHLLGDHYMRQIDTTLQTQHAVS